MRKLRTMVVCVLLRCQCQTMHRASLLDSNLASRGERDRFHFICVFLRVTEWAFSQCFSIYLSVSICYIIPVLFFNTFIFPQTCTVSHTSSFQVFLWLFLKEGFTQKWKLLKMCSRSDHLRSGWVCFFIRFVEMCLCISGWMLCSEWVPSEWESDKNITIIHSTPVHQLTSKAETNPALRRL